MESKIKDIIKEFKKTLKFYKALTIEQHLY